MEARCTTALRNLKECADRLDSLLENVSETVGKEQFSPLRNLVIILRILKGVAKTSKCLREKLYQRYYFNEDKSTNEEKSPANFQKAPLASECQENGASTVEDKIVESFQVMPVLPKFHEDKASIFLGKSTESSQEMPILSEYQNDEASIFEDKIAGSFKENLPSEGLVAESTSTIEDKNTKSFEERLQLLCFSESSPNNLEQESPVAPPKERKIFRVLMDVSNFLPKEVVVKIIGNYLVVQGKHRMVFDEHGRVSRNFTRKFEIPEEVDRETFRALFDCYRVLTIEASLKLIDEKDKEFDVPIREEANSPYIWKIFKGLDPEFEELAKSCIADGRFMSDFARNLAGQCPSDYIPMEKVI